jgi:predicted amidophosphoribosyltransferase
MNNLCIVCSKKLRKDSSRAPHCSRCWLKTTEEGRAFNAAKTKKFYIPRTNLKPRCLACPKLINTPKNQGYCRVCWEQWTEEGREYRCEKVKRSQEKPLKVN